MAEIYIDYLSGADIAALNMTDQEILDAVEEGLRLQGLGKTRIWPREHLIPKDFSIGVMNVLRGYIAEPINYAGVKIVSDFVDNYKHGLKSEMALLNLFDPDTGKPMAVMDAAAITDMRTGAVTALGAKYLARKDSRVLGHIGARGTSYWNVRLMDYLFDFKEIRVHSRRPESREAFGERLSKDLGKEVKVMDNWKDTLVDADILVEAVRMPKPEPLFKTEWVKKGALAMPYGVMSSLELSFTDIMDMIVVDDLSQCQKGQRGGALRAHIDSGKVNNDNIYAEMGEIVAGKKAGRTSDDQTILFWHRGLSLSDIALGDAMLKKAKKLGIGQKILYSR